MKCSHCQGAGHTIRTCRAKKNGDPPVTLSKSRSSPGVSTTDTPGADDSASEGDENDDDDMEEFLVNYDSGSEDERSDAEEDDDDELRWEEVEMPAPAPLPEGFIVSEDDCVPEFKGFKPGPSRHCARPARGEYLVSKANYTNKRGTLTNIFMTAWQDRKPVHILSTFISGISFCGRMVKGAVGAAVNWTKTNFPMPTIFRHYNFGMGGTDGTDQKISNYFPKIKSAAWPVRIFVHMLMVSISNSYIIYYWLFKKNKGDNGTNIRYGLKNFIVELIGELAEEHLNNNLANNDVADAAPPPAAAGTPVSNPTPLSASRKRSLPVSSCHYPEKLFGSRKTAEAAGAGATKEPKLIRGLCCYCGSKKVHTHCSECQRFYCIEVSSANQVSC